jgi:hypothetical protein
MGCGERAAGRCVAAPPGQPTHTGWEGTYGTVASAAQLSDALHHPTPHHQAVSPRGRGKTRHGRGTLSVAAVRLAAARTELSCQASQPNTSQPASQIEHRRPWVATRCGAVVAFCALGFRASFRPVWMAGGDGRGDGRGLEVGGLDGRWCDRLVGSVLVD